MAEVTPANEELAQEYTRVNPKDQPLKYLHQDGSVTEELPVSIVGDFVVTGGATSAKQDEQTELLSQILEKDTNISIDAEEINLNTDELEDNQVNGSQKTQVVDGSNTNVDFATSAKQLPDNHQVEVSNMIPAVETGLATSAKQLADGHNVNVSNMIPAVETGLATSAKQLADGHNVNVSNMIPAVETGLATSANQTNGTQKVQVVDFEMEDITKYNPFIVDTGASLYATDINPDLSESTGWEGDLLDLFKDLDDGLYNDNVTNPKVILLMFYRTLYLNAIGLGCAITDKYFSNIKFEFIGSDGTVRSTFDDSANNTKYGTRLYQFASVACVGIRISVCTANTDVGLTNVTVRKRIAADVGLEQITQNGALAALNAIVEINLSNACGTCVFQVSGTWKGKILIEGAVDGTYNNLSVVQPQGTIVTAGINNDNMNGVYRILMTAGYTKLRLRMSAYTEGTASVVMNASPLVPTVYAWQLNAANLLATVTQSTPDWRSTLVDSTGEPITATVDGSTSPEKNALDVNVVNQGDVGNTNITGNVARTSAVNSKSGLTALQAWEGSFEATDNYSAIQLFVYFNKAVRVYVDQSVDGLTAQLTDDWIVPASEAFTEVIRSDAPFYRVRVTNLENAVATGDMASALTPIINPLPRKLDHNGSLIIGSMIDEYGFSCENTPQGELRTVTPFRIVGAQMEGVGAAGAVDPNYWASINDATAGPGSVTVANSLCSINSGTNAASFAKLVSNRRARYVTGYTNRFRGNFRTPTNQDNNTKRWGIGVYSNYTFTIASSTLVVGDVYSNNGQYFTVMQPVTAGTTVYMFGTGAPSAAPQTLTKVSGATASPATIAYSAFAVEWTLSDGAVFQVSGSVFSLALYKNGVVTPITSFNGHLGISYSLNTNVHTYEIYYTNVNVYFVVDGDVLHTYTASTTGWAATMNFHIIASSINSGNTINTILGLRNAAIHRLGQQSTQPTIYYHPSGTTTGVVLKYGAGNIRGIVIGSGSNGSVITLYDGLNSSGRVMFSLNVTNLTTAPVDLPLYDVPFSMGLTLTVTTQNSSVTVIYE
jgi:hypothetical protein